MMTEVHRNILTAFLLGLSSISLSMATAPKECRKLLEGRGQGRGAMGDFKSYLGQLMENQVVGDKGLARLIGGLARGKFINPITEKEESVNHIAQHHRGMIQRFVDGKEGGIDQKELLEWLKGVQKKKERARVERAEVQEGTEDIYQKMVFHPVKGGRFKIGIDQVEVKLTHDIEVMSTPVTQEQWTELMGHNPSHFRGEDRPVETVGWWDVLEFANRLSESRGFKPVYDLSISGKARINAPERDIYRAEGFRLPTEAEYEYLLSGGGRAKKGSNYPFSKSEIKNHGWFRENAGGKTHPVMERKPIVVGGYKFYDLHGNVGEWSWGHFEARPEGGVNPVHPPAWFYRVIRGGAWRSYAKHFTWEDRPYDWLDGHDYVGFRLVRTIR
ncbi:MAG: formylglycine-generating enzyme family protein [Bacteriovoracales bacterium]|nr:formylglycine-generating enzyme family protein [Bacteriovoracales bacterium]